MPLPDVLDVTLDSGLRVLAARNPRVPMAELRLRIPFGPDATETDDTAVSRHLAAAELLTATLLTGTATRDRVAIDDELAGVGADLGVGVDPERLQIGGSGLAAGLPTVLDVLADVLTGAVHPDAEVVRERSRLVERITVARAQPRTIAREALQRKRFGNHPIAREMPTGPDVAAVEPGDVRALHAAGLVPGGAILTLVGDLDPHEAVALVEQRLGGWTAPHRARELTPPPPVVASNLELVPRAGSVQSQLRLSAPALPRLDGAATPRCSWPTWCSAATSPRAGWRTSARTRATPTARTRAPSSCPAARCCRWRRTSRATSPPPPCWRPATSWAG